MSEMTRTPETIAVEITAIKQNVRTLVMASALEIGRKLEEAKNLVPRGRWGEYLEGLEYSERTAQNLMRLAAEYRDAPQALADLSYTQAVLLLGVPQGEREAFVAEHDMDELSTRELQDEIKRLKEQHDTMQLRIDELEHAPEYEPDDNDEAEQQLRDQIAELEETLHKKEEAHTEAVAQMRAQAEGALERAKEADRQKREAEDARRAAEAREAEAKKAAAEATTALTQTKPEAAAVTPAEVEAEIARLREEAAQTLAEQRMRASYDALQAAFDRLRAAMEEARASAPDAARKYGAAFGKAMRIMAARVEGGRDD